MFRELFVKIEFGFLSCTELCCHCGCGVLLKKYWDIEMYALCYPCAMLTMYSILNNDVNLNHRMLVTSKAITMYIFAMYIICILQCLLAVFATAVFAIEMFATYSTWTMMSTWTALCYTVCYKQRHVPAVTKVPFWLGNCVAAWKGVHMDLSNSFLKQTNICVTTLLVMMSYGGKIHLDHIHIWSTC